MGWSYSRRPIAAPSFYAITTAVTAIRRATQNAIIRFQMPEESRVECVMSCRRKWWRAGPVHPHCRATRAPASSNQEMPSHAFSSPRAQAAAPPVVRLIYNKGPAAAASLKILITVTTMIKRVTQNNVIISLRTTDRVKRVLSCRRKRKRVGQACQIYRAMKAVTLSHPCSRPPARSGSTSSTTLVVVDGDVVVILMTRWIALPLWEVTLSKAMMRMSSGRHERSAAG